MRPLLLTVIGPVTVTRFFWPPSFGVGALYYRDPYNLCGLTRCASARDAATLKARQGPIKKHAPSKEEIKSLNSPPPAQATQYGTSSSYPSRARTAPRESAFSATAASGYAVWTRSKTIASSTRSVTCADINNKSSFEAALLERAPGCEVWRYGFSVDSVHFL
ncbi:hypothetical protein EDB83DRAFT_2314075 [Lactarius deliciosus]|nr:hypothetical protein EDB83DRAFT_2314075 [Lactarius deliciosus]